MKRINEKKKNLFVLSMASLVLVSTTVFAANGESVSASITSEQTIASSNLAIWNCQGNLELDGANESTSTNSLYVQCYEQRNKSIDRKEREMLLEKGNSDSDVWKLNSYNAGKAYYVKLNPKGARKKGCTGSGTLYD